jgi:hypothetical protein
LINQPPPAEQPARPSLTGNDIIRKRAEHLGEVEALRSGR